MLARVACGLGVLHYTFYLYPASDSPPQKSVLKPLERRFLLENSVSLADVSRVDHIILAVSSQVASAAMSLDKARPNLVFDTASASVDNALAMLNASLHQGADSKDCLRAACKVGLDAAAAAVLDTFRDEFESGSRSPASPAKQSAGLSALIARLQTIATASSNSSDSKDASASASAGSSCSSNSSAEASTAIRSKSPRFLLMPGTCAL